MELNEILKVAIKGGASDIHLKSGLPPMFRVDGALVPLKNGERVLPDELQKIAFSIMNPIQKARFDEQREADLAYGIPGLGRFRVNVFQQRGTVGIVFRVIPFGVKTIDQLFLPKVIEKISQEQRGLVLVTGTTGSGKSVCINAILLSILMTRTPQQVKLILLDPKMVELQAYKKVPHLCCEVVTNMKKAPGVLQWAVDEMENRYAMLLGAGVNHIKNYNRLGQQELAKRLGRDPDPDRVYLSYIVIVIDEFADLMNVASKDVEDLIQRLAQKSRAVGMHVILATQRPSSDVITGIIKANLPCQIAFKVNRRIDSRVILDANGAEKLLGHGDMLFMPPNGALQRAQGTFVADEEMEAVVSYLEDQGQQPDFNPDLAQRQTSSRPSSADRDDRYYEAVEVIVGQQRGSATLLQRALAVGYTRATRLLELMEDDGIVGPFVGSRSREVMLTLEEWQARREAEEAAEDEDEYEYVEDDEAEFEGEPPTEGDAVEASAAVEIPAPDSDLSTPDGSDPDGCNPGVDQAASKEEDATS
ncbi:MAG: ATPase, T2SS/T4P/T4SS family [Candidatus Poribacteria bacterium]